MSPLVNGNRRATSCGPWRMYRNGPRDAVNTARVVAPILARGRKSKRPAGVVRGLVRDDKAWKGTYGGSSTAGRGR